MLLCAVSHSGDGVCPGWYFYKKKIKKRLVCRLLLHYNTLYSFFALVFESAAILFRVGVIVRVCHDYISLFFSKQTVKRSQRLSFTVSFLRACDSMTLSSTAHERIGIKGTNKTKGEKRIPSRTTRWRKREVKQVEDTAMSRSSCSLSFVS